MTLYMRDRIRVVVAFTLILMGVASLVFRSRLAPMAEELICTQVDNQASDVINGAIAIQLASGEISYDRMVDIETDREGRVTAVRTNVAEVNRLKTSILSQVDQMLTGLSTEELSVPVGSVILPEFFSGRGPFIPVRILAVRSSDAVFRNEFSAAGINQTLHRISIDIHVKVTILTWSGTLEIPVDTAVLAAETVIVGTVPTTYFGMEDGL
ncbi:MAG: sporulation protein YunB [Oscillospiraceae bacterium]|nr:sporulation protein YunB [Oscillospiraceae bacterium]